MSRDALLRGRRGRYVSVLVVGLLVAASWVASSTGANQRGASAKSAKQSGYLLVGTTDGVDSLNPFVGLNQDAFNTWEELYPALVQYNPKTLKFIPDFATSWKESANGLTWTFHTVHGAHWSDGKPLTARDVAWTYNTIIRLQNGAMASAAGSVANMIKAVAKGPNTVVFHYQKPIAGALARFQSTWILPEHVWSHYATGKGKAIKTFPNAPTSSNPVVAGGPFTVVKWVKNQETVFKPNPYWYGPKPKIQGFALQVFSSADAMVTALKSGQIDAIENLPVTAVKTVKAAGFHVYTGPSMTWRDFTINGNPKKLHHRELLNPLVRKAFEYAINRKEIVKTAWLGYAQPGAAMVSPADKYWHNPNIKPLPFSLAKANRLLNKAGYKMGPNHVRIANGHPMSYQLIFSSDQAGPGDRVFAIIKSDFAKIGVRLNEKELDPSATWNAITANHYRNFDLAMWFWIPLIDPDLILSAYTCQGYDAWNDSGYCNKTVDKLYREQASAVNLKKRRKIVFRMEKLIYESRSEIVLVYNDVIDAWSTKWTGFVESPQGFITQFSRKTFENVHQTS